MLNRLRVLNGYAAHARFLAEVPEEIVGWIPRQPDIPSPYFYSPAWAVFRWGDRLIVIRETRHRRYEVYEVPASMLTDEETATEASVALLRTGCAS